MINIKVLNRTPKLDVVEAEKSTIGVNIFSDESVPFSFFLKEIKISMKETEEWWRGRMIVRHSTLRAVRFRIVLSDVRSDVARQLARHTTGLIQPYVQSKRPDWTGSPRPPEPYPVLMIIDSDAEGWLHLAEQRLCSRAMKETRDTVLEIIQAMKSSEFPYLKALAALSVPRCEALGGRCPEGRRCCGRYPIII